MHTEKKRVCASAGSCVCVRGWGRGQGRGPLLIAGFPFSARAHRAFWMSRGVEALEENAGPRQLTRPVGHYAPLSAAHHRELKYNRYNCFAAAASPPSRWGLRCECRTNTAAADQRSSKGGKSRPATCIRFWHEDTSTLNSPSAEEYRECKVTVSAHFNEGKALVCVVFIASIEGVFICGMQVNKLYYCWLLWW